MDTPDIPAAGRKIASAPKGAVNLIKQKPWILLIVIAFGGGVALYLRSKNAASDSGENIADSGEPDTTGIAPSADYSGDYYPSTGGGGYSGTSDPGGYYGYSTPEATDTPTLTPAVGYNPSEGTISLPYNSDTGEVAFPHVTPASGLVTVPDVTGGGLPPSTVATQIAPAPAPQQPAHTPTVVKPAGQTPDLSRPNIFYNPAWNLRYIARREAPNKVRHLYESKLNRGDWGSGPEVVVTK